MRADVTLGLLLCSLASCDRNPSAPASASVSAPAAPRPTATVAEAAYEEETSTRPIELLKLKFTSAVQAKDPVDELTHAKPGQRVYAHFTLRNRTGRPRTIHVTFRVNGVTRTEVDLDVAESWSYRTWAYNTVLATDTTGKIEMEATGDEGHPIAEGSLPIR